MPNEPVHGNITIDKIVASEFKEKLQMVCIPDQIITQQDRAPLKWTNPNGYCGCGFFRLLIIVF